MKSTYEAGGRRDNDVKPNAVNYNSVINAWGRCKTRGSAQRAEELLRTMAQESVQPDVLSYALVVSAWAHSHEPGATARAEEILIEMEEWAKRTNKEIDFMLSVDGGKKARDIPQKVNLDAECYNTVLIALSKRQEVDATDRAMAILQRMKKLSEEEGFATVAPTAKTWNSVLNTLSRSRELGAGAAQRAEQLLSQMYDDGIKPDAFSFAAILHAYQKSTEPGAAQRADDIVRTMERLYLDGEIAYAPDVYHYTIGERKHCMKVKNKM